MQIKTLPKRLEAFARRLGDIRFAGQVVFVVIVLLISWSGVKSIQTNYGLQKQITALQQQNALQQLENKNLQLESQYYNSNQYLELSARQNFGLASPGEKEILVPESVALKYTVAVPVTNAPPSLQPGYQSNYQAWVNFFLHRTNN
jgi:cell division protein FtsB